ncbi:hypothetical protein B0H10DRAFT_1963469 [Mycena sp. CBHHK59/15]|nr:hypothetical protein B0H10DRAFT_1963469 [Mycena sp. CBHHK59/15]
MENEPPARIRTRDYKENKSNYNPRQWTTIWEQGTWPRSPKPRDAVSVTYTQFLHPISYAYPFYSYQSDLPTDLEDMDRSPNEAHVGYWTVSSLVNRTCSEWCPFAVSTGTRSLLRGIDRRKLPNILYAFEIRKSCYYFWHFQQDDWKIKTLVTVAVLVDTLSAVSDYISMYLYTITHAGDTEYLTNIHWYPKHAHSSFPGFCNSPLGMQTIVSTHRFIQMVPFAQFGSVFACSLMLTLYPSFDDRKKFKIPAALWLVTEVVVDAGIVLVLLWEFREAKDILLTQTQSTVDWLTAITIQSGAAAATLAVAALVSYSMKPESNVYMAFLYPLGRVYVITLSLTISQLSNLNIQTSGRSPSTTVMSPGCVTISERRGPPASTHWVTDDDDSCGIYVHRTVNTSVQVG